MGAPAVTPATTRAMRQVARHVGRQVRERRLALRMTQATLAARMGTCRGNVARLEAGDRVVPSLATIYRAASALNADPRVLLAPLDQAYEQVAVEATRTKAPRARRRR
jgi:transcriptional regulator with XRE-family HTH domain